MQRYLVLSGEGAILRFFTGRGDTFTDGGDIWRGGVANTKFVGIVEEIPSRSSRAMGALICGVCLPSNFECPLEVKLCVLEVEEHARGPISSCLVQWGSDFSRHWGSQKC